MKRKIAAALVILSALTVLAGISPSPVRAIYGQAALEGPFTFIAPTTTTYRYFSENASDSGNASTRNTRNLDDAKTVTVTEEQVLTYWLHTPVHYDSAKKYPVLVYCPGSGGIIFEHEDYNAASHISTSSAEFLSSPYAKYYRQSVYYGESFYVCPYKDINGNWVGSQTVPGDYTASNTALIEQWYDLVYNQGKEEYDCFLIYIQPEDEAWWENHSNLKALCIHTMAQSREICERYGDEIVTYSGGNYNSGYVADELSPNVFSQLTLALIDNLSNRYNIDPQRQYLSGFSLGAQFSFDTMCHYPERFACAVFSGLPASDVTENNARRLTNMNIWTFSGASDYCNKNFSLRFVEAVDAAKAAYGGTGDARATVCTGGHSGKYLDGNQTYSSGDTFTKGSTEIIDFMFSSVRGTMSAAQYENDRKSVEGLKISAITSPSPSGDTYDMAIISPAPLGSFPEHGFIVETGESVAVGKGMRKIAVEGMVRSDTVTLGGTEYVLNAEDYGAAFIYTYVIRDIPNTVTEFTVRAYGTNAYGTFYGKADLIDNSLLFVN